MINFREIAYPRMVTSGGQYTVRVLWRGIDYAFPVSVLGMTNLAQDCNDAIARYVRDNERELERVAHPSDSDQPRPPV